MSLFGSTSLKSLRSLPTVVSAFRPTALHQFSSTSGEASPPFSSILVANRGEIAVRVFESARRMGIRTIALYSDADARAKHVAVADEAIWVGTPPSSDSYLRADRILEAIRETGAGAVHPGYGFLSENASFSQAVEDAGCAFLGPPASAISAMGDKIESKKLAAAAGVNVIPGFLGEIRDTAHLLEVVEEIGYPVMVKASKGGGGKGMRIAHNEEELINGFQLSKQEALASFGDDTMLIERAIVNPRHLEIQLIADAHGNAVYLPERDCSTQRRNQKVIEESPGPGVTEDVRRAMGEQAVALAKAVGYRSAGTVEFIADDQNNFYFLEMNTRLQVEHPISEEVSGIDLVELMIRVGAGEKLPITQDDVKLTGHAVECRVYAEDPLRGYLPCTGRLMKYREPEKTHLVVDPASQLVPTPRVRVDSGIREGSEISAFYDPMIAKLVTWAPTRDEALDTMGRALDSYVIDGLDHNVNLLRTCIDEPRFRKGKFTTEYLAETFPDGYKGRTLTEPELYQLAASSVIFKWRRFMERDSVTSDANPETAGWEFGAPASFVVTVGERHDDSHRNLPCEVAFNGDNFSVSFGEGGPVLNVACDSALTEPVLSFEFEGEVERLVQVTKATVDGMSVRFLGTVFPVAVYSPREFELLSRIPVRMPPDTSHLVQSPMHGSLVSVNVAVGDVVQPGQSVATLEAMKMQSDIRSTAPGPRVVKALHHEAGDEVKLGATLVEFEKPTEE